MQFRRLKQVLKYGVIHSRIIQLNEGQRFFYRLYVFIDMLYCYKKYKIWTNEYLKENLHNKSPEEKRKIGLDCRKKATKRDQWLKEFFANRHFLNKYSNKKYELPASSRVKRNKAYIKQYSMGNGCTVEHGVELTRAHFLPGTIIIGDNVLLAKNVFIDYSGFVEIKNNVKIAAWVIIESHHRDLVANEKGLDINVPTKLVIEENAYIGVRAIILDSCSYIGKNARIGAGAVVTKDVPDYATVVGVPAKVVKINN